MAGITPEIRSLIHETAAGSAESEFLMGMLFLRKERSFRAKGPEERRTILVDELGGLIGLNEGEIKKFRNDMLGCVDYWNSISGSEINRRIVRKYEEIKDFQARWQKAIAV